MPSRVRRIVAEIVVTASGLAVVILLFRADTAWFKRHVLPDFFIPRSRQVLIFDAARLAAFALAAGLVLWVRPRLGRLMERKSVGRLALDLAPSIVAVILALGATEVLLERLPWRARHQAPVGREPVRHWDERLGWVYLANRTGHGMLGGRDVAYSFDAAGYRVRSLSEPVDPARPTIIFVGESIIAGHGLFYDETIPAQVGAATGYAVANLAVGGYATDQMYLRLKDELPRFRRPSAVVALFMPSLFFRTLDEDRPHLTRGLVWRPQPTDLRLIEVARRMNPIHSERRIAEAEADASEQLSAIVREARVRGAVPLIIVPHYGPETAEDQARRMRILDAAGLPYMLAPLDPAWRLKGNSHSDARGAAAIARAIAAGLAARGLPPSHRGAN